MILQEETVSLLQFFELMLQKTSVIVIKEMSILLVDFDRRMLTSIGDGIQVGPKIIWIFVGIYDGFWLIFFIHTIILEFHDDGMEGGGNTESLKLIERYG